jgi:hypothetical protein
VEAGKNTSTVIPASRKRRREGIPVETVMYGYETSSALTTDRLHYRLQTRPLVREGENTSTVIPASRKRRREGNPVVSGNRVVMTSRLATLGQTYPRKHIQCEDVTECRSADERVIYRQGAYKLSAKLGKQMTVRLG